MLIFLVAAGLSIIFGLMDVLNFAQGALFMIGAYVAWQVYGDLDSWRDTGAGLAAALLIGVVLAPRPSSITALAAVAVLIVLGLLPALRRWAGDLPAWPRRAAAALVLVLLAAELFAYGTAVRVEAEAGAGPEVPQV